MPVRRSNSASPERDLDVLTSSPPTPPERLVWLAKATSVTERSLRRQLQQHAKVVGLNEAELLVLWTAAGAGADGVAQNHLVSEVGLSAAQVSNLLDGLRRGGLVASYRSESDRRRQTWRLERSGEKLLSAALAELSSLAEMIFQHLSPEDQIRLADLLSRVRRATDKSCDMLSSARGAPDSSVPTDAAQKHGEAA